MDTSEIGEGRCYVDGTASTYYRRVEAIIDAPAPPGGKLVAWSTDGFAVRNRAGRMWGKCGIGTFAAWAKAELKLGQLDQKIEATGSLDHS